MEGRGASDGLNNSLPPINMHGHVRKRQRSNPGPDSLGYEDMFGGGAWRYSPGMSPMSDPDIDYNAQSSKRYLSEVMASNLTRHMNLRTSSFTASPAPLATPAAATTTTADGPACATHLRHHQPQPHPLAYLASVPQLHPYALQPYGPVSTPMTPPGACSPQRTVFSEMSEGPDPAAGEILQPMLTSDVSLSQGKASGTTAESTSETADSGLLEERERSVSVSLGGGGGGGSTGGLAPWPGMSHPAAGPSGPLAGTAEGPRGTGQGHTLTLTPARPCGQGAAAAMAAALPPLSTGLPVNPGSPIPIPTPGPAHGSPWPGLSTRRLSDTQAAYGALLPHPHGFPHPQQQQLSHQAGVAAAAAAAMRSPFRSLLPGPRGSIPEIPTSPSDTRFGGLDLRKTALLRSLSRRTEEVSSDGGSGAVACGGGGAACVGTASAAGGGMAIESSLTGAGPGSSHGRGAEGDSSGAGVFGSRCGRTQARSMAAGPPPLFPPLPALFASRSSSVLSDGMSEGGGCGGGPAGMETSSTSGDGSAGVPGGVPEEVLEEQITQQQQQGESAKGPIAAALSLQGAGKRMANAAPGVGTSVAKCYSVMPEPHA